MTEAIVDEPNVRTTLRSWTWEWGMLVMILGSIFLVLPILVLPQPYSGILGLIVMFVFAPYCVYCNRVVSWYPTRGDLPEWKAYLAEMRQYHERVSAGLPQDPDPE